VHSFVSVCGNAGEVRWKILLQICALIIYDCNGESMLKVSQQKPNILQEYKLHIFFGSWGYVWTSSATS